MKKDSKSGLPGICVMLALLCGCSGIDLPTLEESEKQISRLSPLLEQTDGRLAVFSKKYLPVGDSEFIFRLKTDAVNRLLNAIARSRSDDLRIFFLPTRPLISEQKSVFGIRYTNHLDIDTGNVRVNLGRFYFEKVGGNRLYARIKMTGKGSLSVSGSYTGIPGSASPDVELELDERIGFVMAVSDTGSITLQPIPGELRLRIRFFVNILGWEIPWNHEIPLRSEELVPSLPLPSALSSSIRMPVPSTDKGGDGFVYTPWPVRFERTSVSAVQNRIEIRADVEFSGK